MPNKENGTDLSEANGDQNLYEGMSQEECAQWEKISHLISRPQQISYELWERTPYKTRKAIKDFAIKNSAGSIIHSEAGPFNTLEEFYAYFADYDKQFDEEQAAKAEENQKAVAENKKRRDERAKVKGLDSYSLIEKLPQKVKDILPHVVRERTDDGSCVKTIKPTQANLSLILRAYGIETRYNVIKREPEYFIEGKKLTGHDPFTEVFTHVYSIYSVNGFPVTQLEPFLKHNTNRNRVNPAAEWIKSVEWDGVERINDLVDTLNLADGYPKELAALLIRKWLIALCKRGVWEEAFQSKGVLILQGPGDIGKTSWFSRLVPDDLFHSVITLDPESKDSVMAATSVWLAEIGEIESTTSKKDINALKGFFSSKEFRIRPPYGRSIETHINRTGFCGTANSRNVIPDDNTGGNRYWVINIDSYDWGAYNKIDKQQIFAEILTTVDLADSRNYELNFAEQEILISKNKDSMRENVEEDIILRYFDFTDYKVPDPSRYKDYTQMSASEVFKAIYGREPLRKDSTTIGAALRQITGVDSRKSNGRLVWDMPKQIKQADDNDF
ncbi:VapE domain-containing protein [Enterobacter hormaechei]